MPKTTLLQQTFQKGRSDIHGQAGGSKEDKSIVEGIMAAVREEFQQEQHLPTLMLGDINANPEKLQNVMELVEE